MPISQKIQDKIFKAAQLAAKQTGEATREIAKSTADQIGVGLETGTEKKPAIFPQAQDNVSAQFSPAQIEERKKEDRTQIEFFRRRIQELNPPAQQPEASSEMSSGGLGQLEAKRQEYQEKFGPQKKKPKAPVSLPKSTSKMPRIAGARGQKGNVGLEAKLGKTGK